MVQIYTVLGALLAAEAASILALPVSVSEVGIVTDVPSLLQPSFVKSQERQLEQNRGVDGQPDNPKKRRTLANEAPISEDIPSQFQSSLIQFEFLFRLRRRGKASGDYKSSCNRALGEEAD
ncbi:MAG: hypothetical protein NXY57DRAFT_631763 [Lentinula lateritia]|nr:MAG: hypothetical protein NXY57DRAFT_631763 [Lentinula lateritia]